MNKNSHVILNQLQRAKDEVKRLEEEYRKVCECNEKLPGAVFTPHSYTKMYKSCMYHDAKFYRQSERNQNAKV